MVTATATGTRKFGAPNHLSLQISQTDLLAGTAQAFVSPVGDANYTAWLTSIRAIVQVALGASAGTLTVKNETTGITIGSVGLAASAAKGVSAFTSFAASGTDSSPPVDGGLIKAGDYISVTPSGFTTSGAVNILLGYNS